MCRNAFGITNDQKEIFTNSILNWYFSNKRSFPWRFTNDPYLVMVSEILLQQTNAEKVVNVFKEITDRYPTAMKLANADVDYLKDIFSELGLFYRAKRLIDIANYICSNKNGEFPTNREELLQIKGIGHYSANAILCFGSNLRYPIVDTNIIRIFEKFFGIKSKKTRPRTDTEIWGFAGWLVPEKYFVEFNYGLLDFGAIICKHYNPLCENCELIEVCYKQLQT